MNKALQTATAEMHIRKPIADVFNAFIDPDITAKFWFTNGSAKLEQGIELQWEWAMYKLVVPVKVLSIVPNDSIIIEWGSGPNISKAKWDFESKASDVTHVKISNYDFLGTEEEIISKVIDSTGGFTLVLSGLKAWLEHGIQLNLVHDKMIA